MLLHLICRPGHGTPPPTPIPATRIPHVFFVDADDFDDYVDMEDLFDQDDDVDTGEMMVVLPSNWTDLTLDDVNDGKPIHSVKPKFHSADTATKSTDFVATVCRHGLCRRLSSKIYRGKLLAKIGVMEFALYPSISHSVN